MRKQKADNRKKPSTQKKIKKLAHLKKYPKEYEEFIVIIEKIGYWNFSAAPFSEEYGVPLRTVQTWKSQYIEKWEFEDLQKFAKPIAQKGLACLRELGSHTSNPDPKIAIVAAEKYLQGMKTFTEGLRSMGIIQFEESPEDSGPGIISQMDPQMQKKIYELLAPPQKSIDSTEKNE